jgi:hypothetical protein
MRKIDTRSPLGRASRTSVSRLAVLWLSIFDDLQLGYTQIVARPAQYMQ